MSSPQQFPPPDPQAAQAAQAAQAGLAAALAAALAGLWPGLDLTDLRQGLPAFTAAVAQQVRRYAQASATLAVRQYTAQRAAAGVRGAFTPVPAGPPPLEQVVRSVGWATQPLWDSAVLAAKVPGAPEETKAAASSAIADAKARLAASSERLVLDAGRNTIVGNVGRDARARGWARIPEPGACSWCAMLAARGAVYRSQTSASFAAHDRDRCHVEPMFTAYEPSARVRQWQKLYDDTAAQIGYGRDGRLTAGDMRRAFRQAYEGRPVDVGKSQPGRGESRAGSKAEPAAPGGRTQEQIRAELTALEKNLPRLTTDQQREWTSKRMNVLRALLGQQ